MKKNIFKNTGRILSSLIISVALMLSVAIPSFASEVENAAFEASNAPEDSEAEMELAPEDANGAIGENIFEDIYSAVEAHIGDILSCLAFLSSLAASIGYKRGILPAMHKSIRLQEESAALSKQEIHAQSEQMTAAMNDINGKIDDFCDTLAEISERETIIEKELCIIENGQKKSSAFEELLSAQVDMLYEIFISSSLPQYQKDAVGERIKKMKELIRENE